MRRKSFSNIYKSLLGGALFAVLATGCNTEDFTSPSTDEKDAVIISAGAALSADAESTTRATIENTWEAGDRIGITMQSLGGTIHYSDRKYVAETSGSGDVKFTSESEDQKMYYPIDGSDVTFKAYYPYIGLTDYPNYPVNVYDQSNIALLDLMTAVHKNKGDESAVNSKNKKEAHLVFHHRLTMVNVNLLTETGASVDIDLTDSELVIKGMKTTGSYNLMTDVLTPDATSARDITIPLSAAHTGRAILLPREAAEGIIFEVTTANGGVYTAAMDKELDLNGGSKYTFNLTLKTTPTLITASIEDWTEGATRDYDIVNIIAGTGTNSDFEKDAELKLYTKDQGATGYSEGGTFTFDGTKWERSGSPLYWESFTGPKVYFKATSTYASALNGTQVPDYLVAETPDIDLYNGVHLEMKHVGAKVTVKLNSSDDTYTTTNLQDATVTLPNYIKSYLFDAAAVTYTPVTADKGDITPEKDTATPNPQDRVAIFPPQEIAGGATLVKVVIGGHTYEVKDGFEYKQGEHHVISLDIKKSGVEITVSLTDWVKHDDYELEVRIGTPSGTATNENIINGDVLKLFTEVTAGTREEVGGHFTYNGATWTYSGPGKLFWEELPNTGKIYAQMERNAVNATPAYNQSKDYIVAVPAVDNLGGVGPTGTRIDFNMEHAVAQVRVVLLPSDTYTAAQLKTADIYLPGYTYDGSLDKGVYVEGNKTGDIRLDLPDNDEIFTRSYLQAQEIPADKMVARVVIDPDGAGGLPPRTYNVTYDHPVRYNAGEITHLYITIVGSEVLVSVKVTPWQDQTPVELSYSFNESPTSVTGFEDNDIIKLYDLGNGSTVTDNKNYTVNTVGSKKELVPDGTPWFRDDFANGDRIVGVYPSTASNITTGNTFSWDMAGKFNPANRENDILVATDGVIADKNANIDLTFNHVLSKVTVNIISGEGFAPDEIKDGVSLVQLVDFMQQGTVNISSGAVSGLSTPLSLAPASIIPANKGVIVQESPEIKKDAELSYHALILPQTKGTNPVLVKVTLNGITYDAQWSGSFNFEAGKHHILNITLAKTGLKLSAKIAEWVPGTNGSITID